jgi:predicted glycoside hydrolase/deacetylase ChbG (UPF0249 family)
MLVITNADDFGISEQLNSCVDKLHRQKLITSATLISKGKSFDHAVRISKSLPDLGVGVHLTLDGPFNVLNGPSSIIDPRTGQFYDGETAVAKLRYGGYKSEDIYKEYCAQIERIYDHGIQITHIDHHHHYHLYYKSLNQVIRVAHKYKIKCVRSQIILSSGKTMFNAWYRRFHQFYLKSRRLITTNGYFDLVLKEEPSYLYNIDRLKQLQGGKSYSIEISTHLYDDPDNYDLNFFQHPDFSAFIVNHRLISYKGLLSDKI